MSGWWLTVFEPWWQRLSISDQHILLVSAAIVGCLLLAWLIALVLHWRASEQRRRLAREVALRTWSWLWIAAIFLGALLAGQWALLLLFAVLSFQALREFMSLAPTRSADHRSLWWIFFVIVPLQYLIIDAHWYGLFAIFIPVWAFTVVTIRSSLGGNPQRFLESCSTIHWGLMICVYGLSHLPALLMLPLFEFAGRQVELVLWIVLVAQASDVLQFVWGKSLGRHPIVPQHSPHKTWEGFIGGVLCACALGMALYGLTPFTPWQALAMAAVVCVTGFMGGVVLSSVKRDIGIKDFGHSLPGHGGVLDRVDSLIFTAPVMFHLLRYYWAVP